MFDAEPPGWGIFPGLWLVADRMGRKHSSALSKSCCRRRCSGISRCNLYAIPPFSGGRRQASVGAIRTVPDRGRLLYRPAQRFFRKFSTVAIPPRMSSDARTLIAALRGPVDPAPIVSSADYAQGLPSSRSTSRTARRRKLFCRLPTVRLGTGRHKSLKELVGEWGLEPQTR